MIKKTKITIARKSAPKGDHINIRVLRTTNHRIRVWAANNSTKDHTMTVPEAIDLMFPTV